MEGAFRYVKEHGIATLSSYPYRGFESKCQSQKNSANIEVTGYRNVQGESQLKQAVGKYITNSFQKRIRMKYQLLHSFSSFSCKTV